MGSAFLGQLQKIKLVTVVPWTSSDERLHLVRGYFLGANSFVGKPNHFTEYSDAVRLPGHHGAGLRL